MTEDRKQKLLQGATGVDLKSWQWENMARLLSDMYPCKCTEKVLYPECFVHSPITAIKLASRKGTLKGMYWLCENSNCGHAERTGN